MKIYWKSGIFKKTIKVLYKIAFVGVLGYAVFFIMRTMVFGVYYIPSDSMEETIETGDYILVDKLVYGDRWITKDGIKRLWGYGNIKRNDIIVFNFPLGDTVFVDDPTQNYYLLKNSWEFNNNESFFNKESKTCYLPVQNRIAYIKRCIGLPGDTLRIKDGNVYCNQEHIEPKSDFKFRYLIHGPSQLIPSFLMSNNIKSYWSISETDSVYHFLATKQKAQGLMLQNEMLKIQYHPFEWYPEDVFPRLRVENLSWHEDEYGPLYIPSKGDTIEISAKNITVYDRLISVYEGNTLSVKDDEIYINGKSAGCYVIQQNYYFMMGDNRNGSLDSRTWGFVPEDHIIGKARAVLWNDQEHDQNMWGRLCMHLN